jgi:hypothetical protein
MKIKALALLLILLATLSGCVPQIYNVDLRYQPTEQVQPVITDGRKFSVTVSELIDSRKIDDPLLIGKVIRRDGTSIPILPRYHKVNDALSEALRQILLQSGFDVSSEKASWNLQEDSILPNWGTILIGGTIDELDITCLDNIPVKNYAARVKISLLFADVQKKKIFYQVSTESSSSLEHVVFSEDKLESQINGALFDAMQKILEGSETIRQIHEALKQ